MTDTAPIVFERVIDANIDEAFALFTEPERLRRWQAASASVDLRVGGDYRLTVVPGSIAYGTFTEIDPGKRLVYTWGWKGEDMPPPSASSIQVDFEPVGDQTRVTMTHSGLDEEGAAGHTVGWTHFFERLQTAASDGDAGLNPWGIEVDEFDVLSSAEATWSICRDVMSRMDNDDKEKPTPCEGFTVHDLVEHLMGSLRGLGGAAGADVPEDIAGVIASTGAAPTGENYIATAVEPVLAAWRERGTDGEVPFGEGTAPASMLAGILSLEFLLHAWDFAKATDQDLAVPPTLVGYVHELAENTIQPEFRGSVADGKGFAPETVPSSDDPLIKLAAFTGRAT